MNTSGIALEIHGSEECVFFTADHSYRQILEDMLPDEDEELVLNMIVPHHGGQAGDIPSSIRIEKPGAAIISTDGNSYGHSKQEVIGFLTKTGFCVYRTDKTRANFAQAL